MSTFLSYSQLSSFKQNTPPKIILYKSRFYMLLLFSLSTLINSCGWICFAPLTTILEDVKLLINKHRLIE